MNKLTVLVDMDDTLTDLLGAWVNYLNIQYGLNVDPNSITDWDIARFFPSLTKEQVMRPINDGKLWMFVKPKPHAAEYLRKLLDDGHRVMVVTASEYETLAVKMNLVLFKYFPFLSWNDVIITSSKQMIRGDVLVDDGVHNLVGGSYAKILVTAPHNRSFDAKKNQMQRAAGWEEIYRMICCLAQQQ